MDWRLTNTADVLLEHFHVICSLLWYSNSKLYFLYWNYWLTCWVPFLGYTLKNTGTMALLLWRSTSSSVLGISKVLKLSVEFSGIFTNHLLGDGETAENKTYGNVCSHEVHIQVGHSLKLPNVARVPSLKFYDKTSKHGKFRT